MGRSTGTLSNELTFRIQALYPCIVLSAYLFLFTNQTFSRYNGNDSFLSHLNLILAKEVSQNARNNPAYHICLFPVSLSRNGFIHINRSGFRIFPVFQLWIDEKTYRQRNVFPCLFRHKIS